jgi:hypothetical protein
MEPGSAEIYFQLRNRGTEGMALFTAIASRQGHVEQVQQCEHDPWMSQTFAEAAIQGSRVCALFVDREGGSDRCPRRNHLPKNFAS